MPHSVAALLIAGVLAVTVTAVGGGNDPIETAAGATGLAASVPADGGPDLPQPSAPALVQRRVDIEMQDYRFSPTSLDVKVGETVTFVFNNTGRVIHDAFIGDRAAQEEHEQQMRSRKDPNDHRGHDGGVTVSPGETGALRYFFDTPGTLEIGCHQIGHYKLGMKMILNVVPGAPSPAKAT